MGRWAKRCSLVLLLVTAPFAARADGPAQLVKNINQTIDRQGSSNTYAFTPAGSYLYFLAADSTHGPELWRTDRTAAGTVPWSALGFAPELGDASQLLALGDDLIVIGDGVWRTDGTGAGTMRLADGDGWWAVASGPTLFLFRGGELWSSDGSPTGTRMLARLGSPAGHTRTVQNVATAGGRIFFTFCDDSDACTVWFSDGSPGGTHRVTHLAGSPYGSGVEDFVLAGSGLFFNQCADGRCVLWHSDGSSAGTWRLVFRSSPPTDCGYLGVQHLVVAGDGVFFTGCDEAAGSEPWHSDGTVQGTRRLADIDPGPGCGLPEPDDDNPQFIVMDGVLYFLAYAPDTGMELWRSDGSPAGTRLLKDINPGPADGFNRLYDFFSSYSAVFTVVDHTLYFAASDGVHGFELWRTDGTTDGTVMVGDTIPGNAGLFDFIAASDNCENDPQRTAVGNALWVVTCNPAGDDPDDYETWSLWRSNGTAAGTAHMEDGIDNRFLTAVGDGVLFAWSDEWRAAEALGRRDAAHADHLGPMQGFIEQWIPVSDGLIFTPQNPDAGTEPWWSDGTPAGTYLLRDIGVQDGSASPADLIALGDVLLFSADDGVHGRELWRSDATEAGTTLVADINPGAAGSDPTRPIRLGDAVLFVADDGVHGAELWRSDGTSAGTELVADIQPGPGGSAPDRFIVVGDRVLFYADDGIHGRELWRSDGTAAGTVLVRDIRPGAESSVGGEDDSARAVLDGNLYFSADDGVHGFALWRTDGSPDGTVMIIGLGRGDEDDVFELFAAGGLLYFDLYGGECPCGWETDGTAAGTHPSGLSLSSPISVDGVTYAFGEDEAVGDDSSGIWRLDSDGTWRLVDQPAFIVGDLFTVAGQLFGLGDWEFGLWRLGVGFEPPNPDLGQRFQFSDVAVADPRVLLYDGYYNALWATDGTAPGTYPLQYLPGANWLRSDASGGAIYSSAFTPAGDHIFFAANSGNVGAELWALPVSVLPEICGGDCTEAPTPVDTDTPTPTPAPTRTVSSITPLCAGDCDHSGTVTTSEVIIGVNIALGSLPMTACPAFEGTVDVTQLIRAVNAALSSCAG